MTTQVDTIGQVSKLEKKVESIVKQLEVLRQPSNIDRIWDMATKIAIPVVVAVVGWAFLLEKRVSIIESNRFTDKDAAKLRDNILEQLPPKWLREDLKEIKDRLRVLEEKVK